MTLETVGSGKNAEERLKQVEARLQQAQQMEALGRLAAGIAHDLNNFLTAIIGFGRMALSLAPSDNIYRSYISEIVLTGDRAAQLVKRLLDFGRNNSPQCRIVALNDVITDLEKFLRRILGVNVDLVLDLGSDLGLISADVVQMEQVIVNLAVNARDAMPRGGRLVLRTRNGGGVRAGFVELVVRDNGQGMSTETRRRIFEPFFTTKADGRGWGLGLAVVAGIVEGAGGAIECESQEWRGTEFRIYWPRTGAEAVAPKKRGEEANSEIPRGNEVILLVEDEDVVRRFTALFLGSLGYKVLEAADGKEGVRSFRKAEKVDLVIADLVMPKLGGRQMIKLLRRLRLQPAVLYISGFADSAGSGMADERVIVKPFTPEDLAKQIRVLLDKSR